MHSLLKNLKTGPSDRGQLGRGGGGSEGVEGGLGGSHSLVEVGLLHGLLAPLEGGAVLILQGLQVRHGLHALQLQTLIVVTCFGVWPVCDKKVEKQDDLFDFIFVHL